jgi:hypothetical protein
MAERLRQGGEDGDLPSDTDVPALAAFYSAVTRGMAVQARDGGGPQKLKAIADVAMQARPAQSRRARSTRPRGLALSDWPCCVEWSSTVSAGRWPVNNARYRKSSGRLLLRSRRLSVRRMTSANDRSWPNSEARGGRAVRVWTTRRPTS